MKLRRQHTPPSGPLYAGWAALATLVVLLGLPAQAISAKGPKCFGKAVTILGTPSR